MGPEHGDDRDGTSVEKAIVVHSIQEEYAWLGRRYPEYRMQIQRLEFVDGSPYDLMELENEQGDGLTVWFDISRFFGKA